MFLQGKGIAVAAYGRGGMKKHISQLVFGGALVSIILALHWLDFPLGAAQAAEPSLYTFNRADIPTRGGELGFTNFTDINDSGRIMGGFTDTGVAPYGFLLNNNFASSEIRCSKNVVATVPQSINKHGEIAGFATVVVERIPIPEPPFEILVTKLSGFFRNRSGKCKILDFPDADLTEALGLNDAGQVVGDYRDADGRFHGFVWQKGSFVTFDVPFAGAEGTALNQLNNVGQSIGIYWDADGTHAFLNDSGTFIVLPHTDATDINDRGQIVGNYADSDGVVHGFVLADGIFTTFDVPFADVVHTVVSGINNRGQVVGRYLTDNPDDPINPYPSHGFIATPSENSKLVASLSKRLRTKP